MSFVFQASTTITSQCQWSSVREFRYCRYPERRAHNDIIIRCTTLCLNAFMGILKGSISLKNRHFIIQERFNILIYSINKLIHGINTIIKCGTWQPVKFQLVSLSWNEMIFLSSLWILVLPTLIQKYDKNHFTFDPVQKRETHGIFPGCQMPHLMIVLIL